ncbi:MAG: peptidylprolyl isomerase [Pseudomonadota bacterium]|jgi:peptidyl-prolyl cis-trans isomerase C
MNKMHLLAGVAVATLLAGCFGGDETKQSGETLATVNGEALKESRIADQLAQIPQNILQGRENEIRRQLLDRVIDQELVAQEAERLDIEKDAEYQKRLNLMVLQLKADAVMARKISESVTQEALQAAYNARRDQLAFPAVKAKHILVPTEAEANAIIAVVTPQNFSQIAKERSKGPSAQQGGDLGWFRREAMIPAFATVAFNTPVGTVAKQPVKTQFGYHVVLVEERNDRYMPPLEQVAPQLREELAQTVLQGYLGDLRKAATITYADAPAAEAPAEAK